eukprot:4811587-Pleurochrysis_carterae.AAC.8
MALTALAEKSAGGGARGRGGLASALSASLGAVVSAKSLDGVRDWVLRSDDRRETGVLERERAIGGGESGTDAGEAKCGGDLACVSSVSTFSNIVCKRTHNGKAHSP